MSRIPFALAATLAAISLAQADTFTDAGKTISPGVVDVSRTSHASVQCVLTVTPAAASLASLWAAAGCPTLPATAPAPQFAWVMPTSGVVYYRTDLTAVTTANGWEIFQNQAWGIEGRLSIIGDGGATGNGLQMIAPANTATSVEVRY